MQIDHINLLYKIYPDNAVKIDIIILSHRSPGPRPMKPSKTLVEITRFLLKLYLMLIGKIAKKTNDNSCLEDESSVNRCGIKICEPWNLQAALET